MKRGAITKADSKLIPVWTPTQLAAALDKGVKLTDTDRSKFIRAAIREKLANYGIVITPDLQ